MVLRDEIETVLRGWNKYEESRSGPPIIDFDCHPVDEKIDAAGSRLAVLNQLERLLKQAELANDSRLAARIGAHLAYVNALLGKRYSLGDYVFKTQGCRPAGWPEEYVVERGEMARSCLNAMGIDWGADTETQIDQVEGRLDVESASELMRQTVADLDPAVRMMTGTSAPYKLSIITAHEDAYWAYWLDGAGRHIRLRLNLRNARFTKVRAQQFGLHEVLGHGLQSASYAEQCAQREVPWVRLMSVHAQHQVLLEGLAQVLPLFVTPKDEALISRVRLTHYIQLVRAELHIAVNSGTPIQECARHARARVPFWSDETISDALSDRGSNTLLRSYLWSYPAGIDWFVRLADDSDAETIKRVLHAAYRDPLTPDDLTALWPAGPPVGGPGK
ncbi:MAG: hypothetical protein DLM59_10840 [Pseudonocardiales bacterium]|nr:MAG: hypothetical protein DLM59_10840 [Pseudonocardiales bacterium]